MLIFFRNEKYSTLSSIADANTMDNIAKLSNELYKIVLSGISALTSTRRINYWKKRIFTALMFFCAIIAGKSFAAITACAYFFGRLTACAGEFRKIILSDYLNTVDLSCSFLYDF